VVDLLFAETRSAGGTARMQSTNWTPEHCAALRENFAKGLSYAQIAVAINATFKTSYTRNAVLGRAKRMGFAESDRPKYARKRWLKRPPRVRKPSLAKSSLAKSSFGKSSQRRLPELWWPVPKFKRTETAELRCAEIDPRHLSLIDLKPSDCRYPYGGDEEGEAITFCGHPRREGSSYCAAHFDLSRGPGSASERAAVAIALKLVEAV
jgi:GcrA cell cycle regulator